MPDPVLVVVGITRVSPSARPETISVPVVPTSPVCTTTVDSFPPTRRVTVDRSPTVVIALLGAFSPSVADPVVIVMLALWPILMSVALSLRLTVTS